VSRVNIVKRIKLDGLWKMFSIPRDAKGNCDWNAIADGRYYVEWYVGAVVVRGLASRGRNQALFASALTSWAIHVGSLPRAPTTARNSDGDNFR
jgi:hypothetical protein